MLEKLKLSALLNGTHDAAGAIITINARDGGTDANDWAEMLLRMYIQWANRRTTTRVELIDRDDNEEAGINSATHRHPRPHGLRLPARRDRHPPPGADQPVQLRRQAPDQLRRGGRLAGDHRRVVVEVNMVEPDIREDTYRASGAGGQHVNKTDSAIRLTHLPKPAPWCNARTSAPSTRTAPAPAR